MKKVISIVMALVMMMAICVPAFALDATTPAGDVDVVVDGITDKGDGSYTVTIPASVDLTWGNDGESKYEITSQVQTTKRVKVAVAKTKDLTNITDATETIEFAVADRTTGIASGAVVSNEVHKFDITVADEEWNNASIAVYEGTITFTAELVDA